MENITVVTALYNIDRETKGDGRKWSEYLEWFKQTLSLPLKMVIYVGEESLIEYINQYRIKDIPTKVIYQPLHEIPYAYYEGVFEKILNDPKYKNTIRSPDRVECKVPFYNIIQYSKFKWLEQIAILNPFDTDYFFWMDAGIGRFIPYCLRDKIKTNIHLPSSKLLIQHNNLLYHYPIHKQYLWDSQCLMCGTMFGGDESIIRIMSDKIDYLLRELVSSEWINNEQILIAYIYSIQPDLFSLVLNNTSQHLCLFEKLLVQY